MGGDIATGAETVRSKWIQGSEVTQRWGCDGEKRRRGKETRNSRLVSMTVGDDRISVRVFVWNVLLSSIICCGFDEWLENRIRLSEIVVNDVHEQ